MLSKRQYLQAMGIDIWTRRAAQPVAEVTIPTLPDVEIEKPSRIRAVRQTQIRDEPGPLKDVFAETPNFRLALLHYGSVGLCCLMGVEKKGDDKARFPRRLCDDIARAVGGNVDGVQYRELAWPMLDTPGIDQSIGPARDVVTQKIKSLPSRVLVMGAEVGRYFPPVEGITIMQTVRFGSQDFLMLPDTGQILAGTVNKRELMTVLLAWR